MGGQHPARRQSRFDSMCTSWQIPQSGEMDLSAAFSES